MLIELGISFDILTQQAEHHFRDGQADVGDGSLFFDGSTDPGEVVLHIGTGDECIALLSGHSGEEIASGGHSGIPFPFIIFGLRFRSFHVGRRRGVLLCFFFLEFFFKILDLLAEVILLGLMRCLFGIESINRFLYRAALFFGLGLINGRCQLCLAGFEFSIFFSEGIQFLSGIRNFFTEHKSFECHYSASSLFSFACISARHFSVFRFWISS